MRLPKQLTASALIVEEGRVFLIRHAKLGLWLYPGGHVEGFEDPEMALHREVREETGLDVQILVREPFTRSSAADSSPTGFDVRSLPTPFVTLCQFIRDPSSGDHYHVDLVYLCRACGGKQMINQNEARGGGWMGIPLRTDLRTPPELPALISAARAAAPTWVPAESSPPGERTPVTLKSALLVVNRQRVLTDGLESELGLPCVSVEPCESPDEAALRAIQLPSGSEPSVVSRNIVLAQLAGANVLPQPELILSVRHVERRDVIFIYRADIRGVDREPEVNRLGRWVSFEKLRRSSCAPELSVATRLCAE